MYVYICIYTHTMFYFGAALRGEGSGRHLRAGEVELAGAPAEAPVALDSGMV